MQYSVLFGSLLACVASQIVSIPYEYTYLLPNGFESTLILPDTTIANVTSTFVNSTTTVDSAINELLREASEAPFISYSDEFLELLGPNPNITLIDDRPGEPFAFEGGVWIPSRNEVWYTTSFYQPPSEIEILRLGSDSELSQIIRPNVTADWKNFQRGAYSQKEDLVYFTCYRDNSTYKGGLVAINPDTYEVTPVFNSYFGLTFNGLNDVTIAADSSSSSNESYLFVSDTDFLSIGFTNLAPSQLYTGLYRWDMERKTLLPAISRTTQPTVNVVKVSPDLKSLIVGDLGLLDNSVPPTAQTIYKYELDKDMWPVNPRLLAVPRFFLDAFQIDDAGRIWAAEGDGIVVRDGNDGRILGVLNKSYFGRDTQLGNVILAGDKIVFLGVDRLWTIQLAEQIVSPTSPHVFGRMA